MYGNAPPPARYICERRALIVIGEHLRGGQLSMKSRAPKTRTAADYRGAMADLDGLPGNWRAWRRVTIRGGPA